LYRDPSRLAALLSFFEEHLKVFIVSFLFHDPSASRRDTYLSCRSDGVECGINLWQVSGWDAGPWGKLGTDGLKQIYLMQL